MAQNKRCMVPDELRGVRMAHSDDVVEVWHGLAEPAVGCGFHVSHYPTELFEAHRALVAHSAASVERDATELLSAS